MENDLLMPKIVENVKKINKWKAPSSRQNLINLDLNESTYNKNDEHIINSFRAFPSEVLSMYPSYDIFLNMLSSYTKMKPEETILTNGADQSIEIICKLFFSSKSRVLIPSPVFSYYYHILNLLGVEVIPIYYQKLNNTFVFPLEFLLNKLDQVDGVILCNPNNPLGTPIAQEDIDKIGYECHIRNIPCIVDEAYYEYNNETSIAFIKKYSNFIVIRTFSKFFCLAGLRLGYTLANPYFIKELLKIRGPWDVNHFSIYAGTICLQNLNFFIDKKSLNDTMKTMLYEIFLQKNIPYYKSNTNFVVINQGKQDMLKILLNNSVIATNLSNYPFHGNLLDNHIRITIPNTDYFPTLIEILNQS